MKIVGLAWGVLFLASSSSHQMTILPSRTEALAKLHAEMLEITGGILVDKQFLYPCDAHSHHHQPSSGCYQAPSLRIVFRGLSESQTDVCLHGHGEGVTRCVPLWRLRAWFDTGR